VVDCFNRPVASPPGAWIDVMRRTDLSGRALSTELVLEGGPHHACLNLGSYNYLGFAACDPYCTPRALAALESWGVSMCASRAEGGGTTPLHTELEALIARHVGAEAALTYGMGFATNSASIPALLLTEGQGAQGGGGVFGGGGGGAGAGGGAGGGCGGPFSSSSSPAPFSPPGRGCLVLSDELNHSSIVAGVKASGARVRVFRHNDTAHLERLLRDAVARGQPRTRRPWKKVLILAEGVYSMEGETCPLREIVALKTRYRAYLYLDEAHSIGALGKTGRGLCEQAGVDPSGVDVLMGTFTKAFGSCGGYVAGSAAVVEHLRRVGPAHLFATAMAPAAVAQVVAALRLMRGEDDEGWRRCCRRRAAAAERAGREGREAAARGEAMQQQQQREQQLLQQHLSQQQPQPQQQHLLQQQQQAAVPRGGGGGGGEESAGAALKRLLLSPLSPRRAGAASSAAAAAASAASAASAGAGAAATAVAFRPVSAADSDATWASSADARGHAAGGGAPAGAAAAPAAAAALPTGAGLADADAAATAAAAARYALPSLPPLPPMEPVSGGRGLAKVAALRANANYFRARLLAMGLHVLGDWDSPIMPVMIYHNAFLSLVSRQCLARRLAVVVVGFPATPLFEGRARVCISAAHTRADLDYALDVIDDVTRRLGLQFGRGSAAARVAGARVEELERDLLSRRATGGGFGAGEGGQEQRQRTQRPQQLSLSATAGGGALAAAAAAAAAALEEADAGRCGEKQRKAGQKDQRAAGAVLLAASSAVGGKQEQRRRRPSFADDDGDGRGGGDDDSEDGGEAGAQPCRFCCAGDEGHFHAAAEAARARHAEQDRLAEAALARQLLLAADARSAPAPSAAGASAGSPPAAGGGKGSGASAAAPACASAAAAAASAAAGSGAASSSPSSAASASPPSGPHAHADGGAEDDDDGRARVPGGCGLSPGGGCGLSPGDWGVDPGALALTRFLRARAMAAGRLADGAGPAGGGGLLAMMKSAWTR